MATINSGSETTIVNKLKRRATLAANSHDHILSRWQQRHLSTDSGSTGPNTSPVFFEALCSVATCKTCGASAIVNANPPTGGEHITGTAPYEHCSPPILPPARPLTPADLPAIAAASTIYNLHIRNRNGRPRAHKIGSVKRWKRDPQRFQITAWNGGRYVDVYYITNSDQLANWTLDNPDTHRFPLS